MFSAALWHTAYRVLASGQRRWLNSGKLGGDNDGPIYACLDSSLVTRHSSSTVTVLRGLRRRFRPSRGEALARFNLRVVAVSPFPEEPEDDETYRPTLIVAAAPDPGDPALGPGQIAVGTLLFVEWAQSRLDDETLPVRLGALLPRLRLSVELGRTGPAHYARHREGQRERYFNHREAAVYQVALHRDDGGLYTVVERRIARGRWTERATLLEAATLAPYEALLRLEPPESFALLAWQSRAVERWLDGEGAGFPVAGWDPERSLVPPDEG